MQSEWKKRIQKPIGVYIWISIIIIKFGILNFIGYFLAIRNSDVEIELHIAVIYLGLCIFTVVAAIWALTGDNGGRIALMVLVPLNILWVILLAVSGLFNNESIDDKPAVLAIIQQTILSLLVIGFEWYFMTDKVVRYYKQNN